MSDSVPRFTQAPIQPRHRAYAQLFHIRGIHPQGFILTGEQLTGLNTHWFDGRPQPCIGGGSCRHCLAGLNIRWKGYVSALQWPRRTHGLLHVTEYAAEQLLALVNVGGSFRGIAVTLLKANESKTAKVIVRRHDVEMDCVLPVGFDPVPVLANLFRFDFAYRRYVGGDALDVPQLAPREITSKSGEEVKR